jgi:hypothetical protein
MHTPNDNAIVRIETLVLRALMLVMAAATVLVGASLLSTPVAVPIAVGLWLGAASMLALGVWGKLPSDL